MASVTTHYDTTREVEAEFAQPSDDPLSGSAHRAAIHSGRSGHLGSAQTGRAEGQWRIEAPTEFGLVTFLEQCGERRAIRFIGVARHPFGDPFNQRLVHRTGTSRPNNAPSEPAAFCPASRTSR